MKPFVWLVTDDAAVAAAHAKTLNPARILATTSRKQARDANQILVHDINAQEAAGLEFVFGSSYGRRRGEEAREILTAAASEIPADQALVFVTVVTSSVLEQLKLGWKFRFSEVSEVDRKWVAECEGQLLASKTVFEAASVALVSDNGGATAVQYIKFPKGHRSSVKSALGNQRSKYITNERPRQSNQLGQRGEAGRRQNTGGPRGTAPEFKERGPKTEFHERPGFREHQQAAVHGFKTGEIPVISARTDQGKSAIQQPKQPKKKVVPTTTISEEQIGDWKSRLADRFNVK